MIFQRHLGAAALAIAALTLPAQAETQLTFKSAKTGTSYYQMGVELAEAVKSASDGNLILTVEESQGSVQNVMEVRARGGDYIFTSRPRWLPRPKRPPARSKARAIRNSPISGRCSRSPR